MLDIYSPNSFARLVNKVWASRRNQKHLHHYRSVKGQIPQLEEPRKEEIEMKTPIASGVQEIVQHNAYPAFYSHPGEMREPATPWSVSAQTLTREPLIIRSANPADAAALAQIGAKGFAAAHQIAVPPEEMNKAVASAWSEKHLAEWITNPEIQVMVAEVEQQIIGMVALNPTDRPSYLRRSAPVELCRYYLHLDWVGCGVGAKLMTSVLRHAHLTGYGICWLRVWQGNKTAIQFYRRWGFTTISADDYAVGNTTVPVWVMIHPIANKAGES
jgi:GNAT superfamily N-acetyltransferase